MPAAEHVRVHVEHGLPGIGVGVEHDPVPALSDALQLRNLLRGRHHITQQLRIGRRQLPHIPVPLPRHDKHMNPSLRLNIPKRKGRLVLEHNLGRNLPRNDPLEQGLGIAHAPHPIHPTRAQTGNTRAQTGITRD